MRLGYHNAMRTPTITSLALIAAIIAALAATPAAAQPVEPAPAGFAETALASCAGGAMIGYLAVLAVGAPSPAGTAALFCGLSVAATTASSVTLWTWRKTTALFY